MHVRRAWKWRVSCSRRTFGRERNVICSDTRSLYSTSRRDVVRVRDRKTLKARLSVFWRSTSLDNGLLTVPLSLTADDSPT